MSRIPTDIPAEIREQAESTLVGHASTMDPIHLSRVAEKLLTTLDPDGDFEPKDPANRAELAFGGRDARTGLTPIKGRLDDHSVAVFVAATDAHAQPRPETDGIKDQRSAATRLAQALTTALEGYLTAGTGPVQGGERPARHHDRAVRHPHRPTRRRPCWTPPVSPSVRPPPAGCCATATSSPPSSARPANRWTSAAPPAPGPAASAGPSPCATAAACSPAATGPPAGARSTTRWHWVDGGPTSLVNAACLCSHHHALIHQGDWQIRMANDGHPEIIPPTWIDPDQRPRRNHLHRLRL